MNLWILTEEKPKISVISKIVQLYEKDFFGKILMMQELRIVPIIKGAQFSFVYVVMGIKISGIDNIFIKTVSGTTSFVDFLVFKQQFAPMENSNDLPIMAIEETKTSDEESRNTGVCQRATKFVFVEHFYPNAKKYMLYNEELQTDNKKRPSETNIIGTNILLTMGVDIVGKDLRWFQPYNTFDEIIVAKNNQRCPPAGNVPIRFKKINNTIQISGRLSKPKDAGNIGHDPNIGTVSMLAKGLRILGWSGSIIVTNHGVSQTYIEKRGFNNKFIYVCYLLDIKLEGITLPNKTNFPLTYWHYEKRSEKVASILLHILAENNGLIEVYQNHAGCERGYFFSKTHEQITLPKLDKNGNKLRIPDLIMFDKNENIVLLIEGKTLDNLKQGIQQLTNYNPIENEYIKKYYSNSTTYRYISIFGGNLNDIPDKDVLLYLNDKGYFYINKNAPEKIQKDLEPGNDSFITYSAVPI